MLHEIIYASRALIDVDDASLASITDHSSQRNSARQVTGCLLFANGYFLQMLEGDPHTLNTLIERIGQDPRHTDLRVHSRAPIERRLFRAWGMHGLTSASMSLVTQQKVQAMVRRLQRPPEVTSRDNAAVEMFETLRRSMSLKLAA